MNKNDIKFLSQVFAIQAEIEAIKIGVEGMKVLNKERELSGYALGYDESAFINAAEDISKLATQLKNL